MFIAYSIKTLAKYPLIYYNFTTFQLSNITTIQKNKFAFTLLYTLFAKNNRLNG